MDGGDLGPQGWAFEGRFFCRHCLDHGLGAYHIVEGTVCDGCGRRWSQGAWRSLPVMDQMYNAIFEGGGSVWDDSEKKFVEVDEVTEPEITFREGEIVDVKGLRFTVDQVRGNRLTLKPIGPRLKK